jgi:hypothetical protein
MSSPHRALSPGLDLIPDEARMAKFAQRRRGAAAGAELRRPLRRPDRPFARAVGFEANGQD